MKPAPTGYLSVFQNKRSNRDNILQRAAMLALQALY